MSLLFFEKVLLEEGEESPPAEDPSAEGTDPPDMGSDIESEFGGDDISGGSDDSSFDTDFGSDDSSGGDNEEKEEPSFGEKISNVLNSKLYQRYLSLLNRVENQILAIKNNLDIFNIIYRDSAEPIEILKKLSENIRIYLNEFFLKENYSKNLLFFNKCINLYKLLNDQIIKLMKRIKDDE